MSFPPPWNDGTAARPGSQAPPPYDPGGAAPPYQGPGGPAAPPPYQPPPGPQAFRAGAPADAGMPDRHRLANWGQRALARIIDSLIVGSPVFLFALGVSLAWGGAQSLSGRHDVADNVAIIYGMVVFLLLVVYETVCVRRWRRTLGKHLARLEVAPLSGAGRQGPIPVASMIARAVLINLPYLASGGVAWPIVLFLLLIVPCFLWPLWDRPNRQGMHDKLAGTVVLRQD